LPRSVPYTDCDGNGNSRCKRYAHGDSNSNTDAHTYDGSKGYPDTKASSDAAAKAVRVSES
jgi:hypothetical protein